MAFQRNTFIYILNYKKRLLVLILSKLKTCMNIILKIKVKDILKNSDFL